MDVRRAGKLKKGWRPHGSPRPRAGTSLCVAPGPPGALGRWAKRAPADNVVAFGIVGRSGEAVMTRMSASRTASIAPLHVL